MMVPMTIICSASSNPVTCVNNHKNKKILMTLSSHSKRSMFAFILIIYIGVASPFALGTTTDVGGVSKAATSPPPLPPPLPPQVLNVATTSSTTATKSALFSSHDNSVASSQRKPFQSIGNFMNKIRGSSYNIKGGETTASLPSKLTFQYVAPLLRRASKQHLTVDDAFDVSPKEQMKEMVDRLSAIYTNQTAAAETVSKNSIDATISTSARTAKKKQQQKEQQKSNQLLKSLLIHQRSMLLKTGILRLCNTAIQAFPSILVARLLQLVEANNPSKALVTAILLVMVLSTKMITENQLFHNLVKMSTQTRGTVEGLIFDKSLKLPDGGSGNANNHKSKKTMNDKTRSAALGSGGVLNLMQTDASMIEAAAMQLHTTWDGPLQIFLYTYLLFQYLGPSVLWGIGVLLAVIPINSITLRLLDRLASYENSARDNRTKRTTEAITHMKLLKLQGWEVQFAQDIRQYRSDEMRQHARRGIVRAVNSSISNAVPALVLVATLTAYAKSGRPIIASTIFTAISLFNQLRFPLFFYPMLIDALVNGNKALQRISAYLSTEEISPYVTHMSALTTNDNTGQTGGKIELKHGNFLWPEAKKNYESNEVKQSPALCNVNLTVNPGEVVAVVGSVGTGKSALVKALLGEMSPVPRAIIDQNGITNSQAQHSQVADQANNASRSSKSNVNGDGDGYNALTMPSVTIHGQLGYSSQQAWLPKGTLRDAVLFGREYDEKRYQQALYDAGLDKDIVDDSNTDIDWSDASSNGVLSHETDVGEGGSNLSGGQRARVALARALYGGDETKVYILDDCLAALDASVGSTVFERLLKRFRETNAAAVIVTNDPSHPRQCDRVVLMGPTSGATSSPSDDSSTSTCSSIVDVGTYDALLSRGYSLQNLAVKRRANNSSIESQSNEYTKNNNEQLPNNTDDVDSNKGVVKNNNELQVRKSMANSTEGGHEMRNWADYMGDQATLGSGHNDKSFDASHWVNCSTSAMHKAESMKTANVEKLRQQASSSSKTKDESTSVDDHATATEVPVSGGLLSADDKMSKEAVPLSTYFSYWSAVRSPILIIAMLGAFVTASSAQFFQQYTVAKWTDLSRSAAGSMATALGGPYLRSLVYAAGVVSVALWLRSFLTMRVCVRASRYFHDKMVSSVFKAPMSFFDATPSGQLLSRFGNELGTIDRSLPDSFASVLFCALQVASSAAALAGAITPGMVLPILLIGSIYVRVISKFRPAARDLKRTEAQTRSPIFTNFGETLRGTEIIRSIPGAPKTWSMKHRKLSDKNLGVVLTVKVLDRWLSCSLETLGNFMVLVSAVASVYLTRAGRLQPGSAGWGLTQSLSVTGLMAWAVRNLTYLESHMMSVVRVRELIDDKTDNVETSFLLSSTTASTNTMPKERRTPTEALRPIYEDRGRSLLDVPVSSVKANALMADGWPWTGRVQFRQVSMRYNSISPLVLDRVSLSVPGGTSLGVVGRTGSGKSSLLLTLFRIVEIETNDAPDASITIDGVDIRSIPIQTLREKLTIIPQDPVLFTGTIAFNLDATETASDADMWKALETASPELASQFRQNGMGLKTVVSEGGSNFSLGQRQLLCLARAVLRKSRIVVLDEATSSVDAATDQQVQETIRREFVEKGVTVITVAHRLDTVLGYDKVAVLGNGKVLEYGSPNELLEIPNGELRRLVDADKAKKQKGGVSVAEKQTTTATKTATSTASNVSHNDGTSKNNNSDEQTTVGV